MQMNYKIHTTTLNDLKQLLTRFSVEQMTISINALSGSSIVQHFRHIIEFYICLFNQLQTKIINYDLRKRNITLETNPIACIMVIDEILSCFKNLKCSQLEKNHHLELQTCFHFTDEETQIITTSLPRELTYCLDHCVHHQHFIKIGLIEQGLGNFIHSDFGIAFSTLKHLNS